MEQGKKNIRLIIILVVLVGISFTLSFFGGNNSISIENADQFQLNDTTGITTVTMASDKLLNRLQKTDSGWTINAKYLADESIIIVLFSVMQKVEILREIDEKGSETISDKIKVEFKRGEEVVQSFYASANPTKTLSVFSKNDESYVVNLPGYESFVTGIFEIPESDWRNRMIVSMGPFNMDAVKVNYLKEPEKSFEIKVANNFPFIENVARLDTLKLMDYLEQFSYFQVDEFVALDEYSELDSIAHTDPWISFSFEELNAANDVTLTFFHKKRNDPNILALVNDHQPVLFNYRRIAGIFKEKEDFLLE